MKNNKLEIIGFVTLAIGGIWKVLEKLSDAEIFEKYSSYAQIVFFLGLAIWALGLMKKESDKKKNKENL